MPRVNLHAYDDDEDDGVAEAPEPLEAQVLRLEAELVAERARTREVVLTLRREVEATLAEADEASRAAEAQRSAGGGGGDAAVLAAAQAEAETHRANAQWLAQALETAQARCRLTEEKLAAVEHPSESATAARVRAPLEARLASLTDELTDCKATLELERRRFAASHTAVAAAELPSLRRELRDARETVAALEARLLAQQAQHAVELERARVAEVALR